MRFTIDRKIFCEMLKSMIRVVPAVSVISELMCFKIEANEDDGCVYLTANNLECAIQRKYKANVEEAGSALLKARLLLGIVERLGRDDVTVSVNESFHLHIECGTTVYELVGMDPKGFPETVIPFPEDIVKLSGLKQLYERTSFAVSTDKDKPALKGIHLEANDKRVRMTACDARRMSVAEAKREGTGVLDVILPKSTIAGLVSAITYDDELEAGNCGARVVFMKEGLLFSACIVPETYIDADRLLSSVKHVFLAKVDNEKFKIHAERIADMANMGERTSPVKIELTNASIRISTENDVSCGMEEIEAVVLEHGGDMTFYYQPKHIKELFKAVTGETIISVSDVGYLLAMDECTRYMVSPRAKPAEVKLDSSAKKKKAKPAKAA